MNTRTLLPRTLLFLLVSSLASTVSPPTISAQNGQGTPLSFAPDRVLISFEPGTAAADVRAAHATAQGRIVKVIDALGVQVVAVPNGTVGNAIQKYERNPNVKFAEPNFQRPLFRPATTEGSEPGLGIANNFSEQWALDNTGQSFGATVDPLFGTLIAPAYTGIADADIDAPEGWAITHGSASVKIAILDSGIACQHADLDSKCIEQVNFVDEPVRTSRPSPSQRLTTVWAPPAWHGRPWWDR